MPRWLDDQCSKHRSYRRLTWVRRGLYNDRMDDDRFTKKIDPRVVFDNHHERGPKRYQYTVNDVARIAGLTVGTVRNYQYDKIVCLSDLESVVRFLAPRLSQVAP